MTRRGFFATVLAVATGRRLKPAETILHYDIHSAYPESMVVKKIYMSSLYGKFGESRSGHPGFHGGRSEFFLAT
jgi:hypothetical protein